MLLNLNIKNFGSYVDFDWDRELSPKEEFRRNRTIIVPETFGCLNIIFGRNYSGKTTLSEIFRSLELGEIPAEYTEPDFFLSSDNASGTNPENISSANLSAHAHTIRVFNRSFVRDHLSFLIDDRQGGRVNAFAVLGADNRRIREEMQDAIEELGCVDPSAGVLGDSVDNRRKATQAQSDLKLAEKALAKIHSDRVNSPTTGLKHDNALPAACRIWRETQLRARIDALRDVSQAGPAPNALADLRNRIGAPAVLPVLIPVIPKLPTNETIETINAVIQRALNDTAEIHELAADAALHSWAQQGQRLHENRKICAFCNSELTSKRRDSLDRHFSNALDDLNRDLGDLDTRLRSEKAALGNISWPNIDAFLGNHREACDAALTRAHNEVARADAVLTRLIDVVKIRLGNPLHKVAPLCLLEEANTSASTFNILRTAIQANNDDCNTQEEARDQLREDLLTLEIARHFHDAKMPSQWETVDNLRREARTAQRLAEASAIATNTLEARIINLQSQLSNQTAAAEKINALLEHEFGLRHVRFDVEQATDAGDGFVIRRGTQIASNLSEGEKSLIAFCYFMVRLEAPDTNGSKLTVFIDDPMSSLDNDHVFFIYGLIAGRLAQNLSGVGDGNGLYEVEQLFISTHSLELLRFCKRLPCKQLGRVPKKKHFIIESTDVGSNLRLMPNHLREDATLFIYLFDQVRYCGDERGLDAHDYHFHNFGNNARRLLEILMFFKYPHSGEKNRQRMFYGQHPEEVRMVERVINEYSHNRAEIERSLRPLDKPELAKVARFILRKIREHDGEQYRELIAATGKSDPIEEG